MKLILKNPTKVLGFLLFLFGALQAASESLRPVLSPTGYAIYVLAVGIVVLVLSRLRDVTGGFLLGNKLTWIAVVLIVLSALQEFSSSFQSLVSPGAFSVFNIALGLLLKIVGFLNSSSDEVPKDPPPAGG